MMAKTVTMVTALVLAILLPVAGARAASAAEQWHQTLGGTGCDKGYSVQQTSDGGYIVAGDTTSYGAEKNDVLLIKTDSSGNEQWHVTFGGPDRDYGRSVQQTSDGGYIVAGYTQSYGAGGRDVWLIKTDSDGNEQWNKTFGGPGTDYGHCVRQTTDGGYIIAGETTSYGVDSRDVWLIKTDSGGNEQWNKTFGGGGGDVAHCVQQTTDGGYVITGMTSGGVLLIKTDSSGDELWYRVFGPSNDDWGYYVEQTSDGGYIIAGLADALGCKGSIYSQVSADALLIKTDSSGNEQWGLRYGGSDTDCGRCVRQTRDGGYIVAGSTASYEDGTALWLIKTDWNGNAAGIPVNRVQAEESAVYRWAPIGIGLGIVVAALAVILVQRRGAAIRNR